MSEPHTSNPIWVDEQSLFNAMIVDLSRQSRIAVDTESNSLYAYREQVCLIQFSSENIDYLVDPLTNLDLSALKKIFADSKIEKIFHAAEYDLICLKRDFGFSFVNIFDTMIAGRILGYRSVGLASMLETIFQIEINKKYQRANWGRRPLPEEMIQYACQDTHNLIPLRNKLKKLLEKSHRTALANEDFIRLCGIEYQSKERNGTCWRVVGNREMNPQQLSVLQSLCDYRELMASKQDTPPFKILSNRVLVNIALASPDNEAGLWRVEGLSAKNIHTHGSGLLKAIQSGLNGEPPQRQNHKPKPNDHFIDRLDILKNWRKTTGQKKSVPSDIVLPRDIMELIAKSNPRNLLDLEKVMQTTPYRFDQYGKEILEVINTRR